MRFDHCARTYDANAAPQREFAARVAGFIRPSSGDHLLELGAGTGALTQHLCAVHAVEVCATDKFSSMVELGRKAVPSAQWQVLDAFHDRVPVFGLQVSSGLLQWAEDPVQILTSWSQALIPGGRMVHAFPCHPCLAEWRALIPENPVRWHDQATWLDTFKQAGLRVCRHELWVEQRLLPSSLELIRSFHRSGVTGSVQVGPGRLRGALRMYDARHRCSQGVAATWAWLAVEAQPLF